ncbi:hypothetical protein BKA93DRAFT_748060 [Sparassis latifolia]
MQRGYKLICDTCLWPPLVELVVILPERGMAKVQLPWTAKPARDEEIWRRTNWLWLWSRGHARCAMASNGVSTVHKWGRSSAPWLVPSRNADHEMGYIRHAWRRTRDRNLERDSIKHGGSPRIECHGKAQIPALLGNSRRMVRVTSRGRWPPETKLEEADVNHRQPDRCLGGVGKMTNKSSPAKWVEKSGGSEHVALMRTEYRVRGGNNRAGDERADE